MSPSPGKRIVISQPGAAAGSSQPGKGSKAANATCVLSESAVAEVNPTIENMRVQQCLVILLSSG